MHRRPRRGSSWFAGSGLAAGIGLALVAVLALCALLWLLRVAAGPELAARVVELAQTALWVLLAAAFIAAFRAPIRGLIGQTGSVELPAGIKWSRAKTEEVKATIDKAVDSRNEQALEVARGIGDEYNRAEALVGLAPYLDEPGLRRAQEVADQHRGDEGGAAVAGAAGMGAIRVSESDKLGVLARAEVVAPLLVGARILWVDDHPERNGAELSLLRQLGISTDLARSTQEALDTLLRHDYDAVISDMDREGSPDEGLTFLRLMRERGPAPRAILYVGRLEESRGTPPYAFAITNRPDHLLHCVMDVLERERALLAGTASA